MTATPPKTILLENQDMFCLNTLVTVPDFLVCVKPRPRSRRGSRVPEQPRERASVRGRVRRSVPTAIVTPAPVFGDTDQDRWHECDRGSESRYEKDLSRDWTEIVYLLYEMHDDHFAVCLGCHR